MHETSQVYICPPSPYTTLSLEDRLSVGFGWVEVTRDGESFWHGDNEQKKMRSVEVAARREPERLWKVRFNGPLQSATYERQARDTWVLVEKGRGFA